METPVPPKNPDIFDTPAAAAYLHLSTQYLEKMRVVGGSPAFLKIGKAVRYRRIDLDRWLDEKVRTSTSDRGAN